MADDDDPERICQEEGVALAALREKAGPVKSGHPPLTPKCLAS